LAEGFFEKMLITYTKAIEKQLTKYPKIGDEVYYKARSGRNPVLFKAWISRIINKRTYIVEYNVPEDVKKYFRNGTTKAVTKLNSLLFEDGQIENQNEL
jgi:hypothetical protein